MRAFVSIAAFLLVGLLIPQTGFAQESVGKAIVDGKTVTLYSDNTWKYVTVSGEAGCVQVTVKLSFCGDLQRWRPSPTANAIISAAYSLNASTYGQYIVEDIGTSNGISAEFMRGAIIQVAGAQSDREPVVLGLETGTFQDAEIETVIFQVLIKGLPVVFATSLYLTSGTTAQITTYELGQTYSDAHKAAHTEFLAATRIEG